MGERTQYTPGTFSWTDLTHHRPGRGQGFYTRAVRLGVDDMPDGDGSHLLDGRARRQVGGGDLAAAATSSARPACRRSGTPTSRSRTPTPRLARARELGAPSTRRPFDVMRGGPDGGRRRTRRARTSCSGSPSSTSARSWSTRPGRCRWNELGTPDMDGAAQFYGDLLGWTTSPMEGGHALPWSCRRRRATATVASGRRCPRARPRSGSSTSAPTTSTRRFAKVPELGGTALAEPMDIGVGRSRSSQDPQGAVFALFGGDFQD